MPGGAGPGPGRAARAPRAFLAVVDNSAGALWAGGAGGAGGPGARLGRQVRAAAAAACAGMAKNTEASSRDSGAVRACQILSFAHFSW